MLQHTFGEVSI